MAASVIIRVELRGDPSAEVYKKLHEFMQKTNGWNVYLDASNGTKSYLPRAMYADVTESELGGLAKSLKDSIESSIWKAGAIVLVIAWSGWGQSGQP